MCKEQCNEGNTRHDWNGPLPWHRLTSDGDWQQLLAKRLSYCEMSANDLKRKWLLPRDGLTHGPTGHVPRALGQRGAQPKYRYSRKAISTVPLRFLRQVDFECSFQKIKNSRIYIFLNLINDHTGVIRSFGAEHHQLLNSNLHSLHFTGWSQRQFLATALAL